ncbi:MAG: CPBP family intramembrane glutamic endopeptidase [Chitinophagaceae bacterium]
MLHQQKIAPLSQFLILIGLCGFGIVLGGVVLLLLAKWILGISALGLEAALNKPENVQFARIAQSLGAFCMLAVPVFLFAIIIRQKPLQYLGFSSVFNIKQIIIVALIALAALAASDAFAALNEWIPLPKNVAAYFKNLEDQYNKDVMTITHMTTAVDYLISLIVIALLPAMFEEMFFRGALQQVMIGFTKNVFIGILITSIFFSAIHLSYYGFLPRLFLGIVLGYIFYYGKNIWLNILMHFFNNAIALTQMYLLSRQGKLNNDSLNDTFPFYFGIIGLIAVIALLIIFKNISEKLQTWKKIENEAYNIH